MRRGDERFRGSGTEWVLRFHGMFGSLKGLGLRWFSHDPQKRPCLEGAWFPYQPNFKRCESAPAHACMETKNSLGPRDILYFPLLCLRGKVVLRVFPQLGEMGATVPFPPAPTSTPLLNLVRFRDLNPPNFRWQLAFGGEGARNPKLSLTGNLESQDAPRRLRLFGWFTSELRSGRF